MGEHFRDSMMWLHTWAGIVIGGLLFAIFWMGTLAVYDQEVDRWMMPATRIALPEKQYSVDDAWRVTNGRNTTNWQILMPTERTPIGRVDYTLTERKGAKDQRPSSVNDNNPITTVILDPRTNEVIPDQGTRGGQDFFFPFHWNLTITSSDLGVWVVGLAGMAMLALLVTGVIIHRTIFINFFTLRANKKAGRVTLDIHNITGVLALPFHFMITLSGLVIWFYIYFPTAWHMAYDSHHPTFYSETRARYDRPKLDKPGTAIASIDRMIAEAEKLWGSGKADFVHVWHPQDANAYVEIRRSTDSSISIDNQPTYFDAASGRLIHYERVKPISKIQRFLAGLHFTRFKHWTLHWVYFVLGMSGCVLIATGSLFWLEARRKRHAGGDSRSIRVVEGLTIGSVSGIIVATLAFMIVNRILPLGIVDRAAMEVWTFFLVWIATFAHGWWRRANAWIDQCWIIAAGSAAAVILNWVTTGDHLAKTMAEGNWPVAGVDLFLMFCAGLGAISAWALQNKRIHRGLKGGAVKSLARESA